MKPLGPIFDRSWRITCRLEVASRAECQSMIAKHYLGKWPGVCVLILALKRSDQALGCIVFALPPRETSTRYGANTWELARLWLTDDVPKNAETWVISQAIKYIKRHHRDVAALVSYADPSAGHSGVIYKASNWISDGRTDDDRKSPRFDYADAATGKKYSRCSHIPDGVDIVRIPRVSKHRFVYRLRAA